MVYQNQYAVAVVQDGKIVPEQNGGVTLPYGSEYKIRLKNKSRQKSIADVYLDGKIACKGIILGEDGVVDLERYIRPGDSWASGAKFKLARLSHPGISDENDDQNGLLEVRFYKELVKPKAETIIIDRPYPVYPQPWQSPPWPNTIWCETTNTAGERYFSPQPICSDVHVYSNSVLRSNDLKGGPWNTLCSKQQEMMKKGDGPAATVQGGLSKQSFTSVSVEIDEKAWTGLYIRLRGVTKVTRLAKCECGHSRRSAEKFCPKCGEQLVFEG